MNASPADTVILIDLDGTIIPDQEAFRDAATTVLNVHLSGHRPGDRDPVDDLLTQALGPTGASLGGVCARLV
jgi:hypothetical protein